MTNKTAHRSLEGLFFFNLPPFQSRESLRPLLQESNDRKPLHIIHFTLLKEYDRNEDIISQKSN